MTNDKCYAVTDPTNAIVPGTWAESPEQAVFLAAVVLSMTRDELIAADYMVALCVLDVDRFFEIGKVGVNA